MITKLTLNAAETVLIEELPLFLREEKEKFLGRNKISGDRCCPWCLKAYLIERAKEKGMEDWAISMINQKLPGRSGHNGYYEDGGEIVKLD
jgi:hypothetical protein